MGYRKTNNLYKDQRILMLKECYALEKIHGTSAHIKYHVDDEELAHLTFYSGGEKHENFIKLFDEVFLMSKFKEVFGNKTVTIYGEAYGGKCQGMSKTYGAELKFIGFEVNIDGTWLDVPNANDVCDKFNIEFVDYVRISTDLEAIDAERDKDSVQAIRNGMGEGHLREGVVLRPLVELVDNRGERIMCKHKRAEFGETKTPKEVSPDALTKILDAQRVADEWCTAMRLEHVLDHLISTEVIPEDLDMKHVGFVIKEMQTDIMTEGKDEIEESKQVYNAIAKKTVKLFEDKIKNGN